jgi:hypothetical protein
MNTFRLKSIVIKYVKENGICCLKPVGTGTNTVISFILELTNIECFDNLITINEIYSYEQNIKYLCHYLSDVNFAGCDRLGKFLIPLKYNDNEKNLLCEPCLKDIVNLTKIIIHIEGEKIFKEVFSKFMLLKYSYLCDIIDNDTIQYIIDYILFI